MWNYTQLNQSRVNVHEYTCMFTFSLSLSLSLTHTHTHTHTKLCCQVEVDLTGFRSQLKASRVSSPTYGL